MRIARPWALELEYTRELMLPLILRDDPPVTVLQIGLGAASITRYLHRHFPQAWLTVVEIDPRVTETARQFFKLPEESERLRILTGEGHEFLATAKGRFDSSSWTDTTKRAARERWTHRSSTRRPARASHGAA
jgi:predicted membrane-bound spermidine synthase